MMILLYLARVYNSTFLKRGKTPSNAGQMPTKTDSEIDSNSLLDSPELLKLKRDIW